MLAHATEKKQETQAREDHLYLTLLDDSVNNESSAFNADLVRVPRDHSSTDEYVRHPVDLALHSRLVSDVNELDLLFDKDLPEVYATGAIEDEKLLNHSVSTSDRCSGSRATLVIISSASNSSHVRGKTTASTEDIGTVLTEVNTRLTLPKSHDDGDTNENRSASSPLNAASPIALEFPHKVTNQAQEDSKYVSSSQKTTGSAVTDEAVDDWAAVPEKLSNAADHRAPTSFGVGLAVVGDLTASLSGEQYYDDNVQGLVAQHSFFESQLAVHLQRDYEGQLSSNENSSSIAQ
jgi:hypothetical protein